MQRRNACGYRCEGEQGSYSQNRQRQQKRPQEKQDKAPARRQIAPQRSGEEDVQECVKAGQHPLRCRARGVIVENIRSAKLAELGFRLPAIAHGDGGGRAAIIRLFRHGRKLGLCLPQAVEILQGLGVAHADGFRVQAFIACELDNESFAEGHQENRIK